MYMKNDPIQGILFDANPELRFIVGRSASILRFKKYLQHRKERDAAQVKAAHAPVQPVVMVRTPGDRIPQDSVAALSKCLRAVRYDEAEEQPVLMV